jgi:hypothetical protein
MGLLVGPLTAVDFPFSGRLIPRREIDQRLEFQRRHHKSVSHRISVRSTSMSFPTPRITSSPPCPVPPMMTSPIWATGFRIPFPKGRLRPDDFGPKKFGPSDNNQIYYTISESQKYSRYFTVRRSRGALINTVHHGNCLSFHSSHPNATFRTLMNSSSTS